MAMTNIEIAKELAILVELDMDAIQAYSRAIPCIGSTSVKDLLIRFRQDHERHVEQLSAVIRALDVLPPSPGADRPGCSGQTPAAVDVELAEEGALQMIRFHEELATSNYGSSSGLDLTPNIKELVMENYQDEQVHLRFISGVLAGRAWQRRDS